MATPLAERLRPKTLDDYIGQSHLVGPDGVIRKMLENKRISSFILWGPPGVGKTTLANIVAQTLGVRFFTLSAINSGVKDVREVKQFLIVVLFILVLGIRVESFEAPH